MIWSFLAGVLTTIVIIALVVGCVVFVIKTKYADKLLKPSKKATSLSNDSLNQPQPTSAPLKSMTPYERSLEDGKEIKERIEHLLQ